ncbi:hypothetical protein CA13_73500 [Planctomycetes bacterium CA13]|uniref:Uncharacterized protein n=2 Tax=Novipirellula herctigrandis TaxID=2527986 RepID=A0A5C5YLT5_9BACT|nr:hypothetical protein CA13_73500 [Planctomycetes bacterium CA13]
MVAIAAIWFMYMARQDAARCQLIRDIASVGGTVTFDESQRFSLFRSQRVTEVVIPYANSADVGMTRLASFPNLSELGLKDVDVTNEDGLRFQTAELRITNVTDDMLEQLEGQTSDGELR